MKSKIVIELDSEKVLGGLSPDKGNLIYLKINLIQLWKPFLPNLLLDVVGFP